MQNCEYGLIQVIFSERQHKTLSENEPMQILNSKTKKSTNIDIKIDI